MIQIFKLFKKEIKQEEDIQDRTVSEIYSTFQTVLGEEVSYTCFYKLDCLRNGLTSFNRLELLNRTVHVRGVTYNTDHIVSLKSEVVGQRVVKREVKDEEGYYWSYRRSFSRDELE